MHPHAPSTLLIGAVDYPGLKDMVYTPLVPKAGNHFWTLSLDSISVGGTPVNAPAVSGAPTFPALLHSLLLT